MKLYLRKMSLIIVVAFFYACNAQKEKDLDDGVDFTIEEAQAIIDKYNLIEGSIILRPKDSLAASLQEKDPELAKSLSEPPLMPMTKAEFEKQVAAMAAYQQSDEGQIAKKIGDFYRKHEEKQPTDKQLDSLYLAIDGEYGTDYWQNVRGPLPPGVKRFSSIGNKPMTQEP